MFFLGDLVLIGWLVLKAYRDADTLDRFVLLSPLRYCLMAVVLTLLQVRGAHRWAHSKSDSGRRVMHREVEEVAFCVCLAWRIGVAFLNLGAFIYMLTVMCILLAWASARPFGV